MIDLRKAAEMALKRLERSESELHKARAELRQALSNEFNPDWNQVEALQESLREHMAEIQRLRQALAMEKFSEVNQEIEEALKQPKREWVGLTDEEIDGIYKTHHDQYGKCQTGGFEYERTIEAKLKEKNT